MDNRAIGLIDSGVGGFTVLKELQETFPQENFIYFGDSEHMPYGERPNGEIIDLVNTVIKFLEDKNVKTIVLACNTASSLIEELTSKVKLFSIVDAGCQAVLDYQSSGPVGLIATRATVKNKAYDQIMPQYSKKIRFISYGTPTLAQVINDRIDEVRLLKKNIENAIEPILKEYPIKSLLLGCTHYPIVSKTIREMYPHIWLINPALKESSIIHDYLVKHDMQNELSEKKSTTIYISGGEEEFKRSQALLKELGISYDSLKITHI